MTTDRDAFDLEAMLVAAGLDTVEGAFAYAGGGDMTVPGLGHRQRWTLTLADESGRSHVLFMKRYEQEPLTWRIKRWLTYGWGGSPATVERDNIFAAQAAGVATIGQAYAAEQSSWCGARRSYIVMTRVAGEALEQCMDGFIDRHGLTSEAVVDFTRKLAELVGRFHRAGYVHRDLYTSHVFLAESPSGLSLCLIDLARMFRPRWRRFRWKVKDLAQLKYSMPERWIQEHWETFASLYHQGRGERLCRRYRLAVDRKVASIARHVRHKQKRKAVAGGAQRA